MKRSDVNRILREAEAFFESMRFALPPVARWRPADWRGKGGAIREIVDVGIGWDLTDFGLGEFRKKGLLLFTLRNGKPADARYAKPYAEKIMIVEEEQLTLTHFHWSKAEDIINRGGGNLVLRLHNATADERLADTPVTFQQDGVTRTVPAGGTVTLQPGESITLTQRLYHSFWGEPGRGKVLVGEVSAVNDDHTDNRFLDPHPRFPAIEEDEPPLHLLVSDYETWLR
jgi:D-lyxose ketol-isomerase